MYNTIPILLLYPIKGTQLKAPFVRLEQNVIVLLKFCIKNPCGAGPTRDVLDGSSS